MNKDNIKEKATALFATLSAMILVASVFVPLAGATNNGGKVIERQLPKIDIKENSRTSQIVQIGDTLITLTADQNHTKGLLKVKNLKTGKVLETSIKVNKEKGKYRSTIESPSVTSSVVTDYDPFEPGTASQILKNNQANSNVPWPWDNIKFVDYHNDIGLNYPHPDYKSYPDQNWDQTIHIISLPGDKLYHNHIDSTTSTELIPLSIFAAALIIGVLMGYTDPISLVNLALRISNYAKTGLKYTMLDESGAIWFWDSIGTDRFAYLRIAAFTIQDKLGMGFPTPPSPTPPPKGYNLCVFGFCIFIPFNIPFIAPGSKNIFKNIPILTENPTPVPTETVNVTENPTLVPTENPTPVPTETVNVTENPTLVPTETANITPTETPISTIPTPTETANITPTETPISTIPTPTETANITPTETPISTNPTVTVTEIIPTPTPTNTIGNEAIG